MTDGLDNTTFSAVKESYIKNAAQILHEWVAF